MDISSKQKINKGIQVLNNTLDEMDLIDVCKTFHPNADEYTFLSAHGTFSRIDMYLYKYNQSMCLATKQASINLRKLKSYQASFLTTAL